MEEVERAGGKTGGLLFAVGSGVAFGTLAILGKLAYEVGAQPLPLLAARFSFAAVLLAGFQAVTGQSAGLGRRTTAKLALVGLVYGLEASLFFFALDHAPAASVSLIFYSYPLWTNLIGLGTGLEKFRARVFLALVLGTAGVVSIFEVSELGLLGPLLALAAAVSVAIYFLLAQVLLKDISPAASATWTTAGAALAALVATGTTQQGLPAAALPHAMGLAVASAISFVLVYAAIARIGSARTSVANMVEPVTTVVLAALILGEEITLRIAIGAVLVISALPILASAPPQTEPFPPSDSL
jgi:drug/metabolite transporter (DMT)-like permease